MTDDQLLRYSRHILLDDIGIEGQTRISAAHALIIGAGGLGSPVALYLGSAGVGQITIIDHDAVDVTNLQRQIAHSMADASVNKAVSATQSIASINPEVKLRAVEQLADAALLAELVPQASVVLDCCDNFATRQAINAACVAAKVPLVSGAAIRWDGQITVFDAQSAASPCYACLFPPDSPPSEERCATMGVLAPLVGIIGSMQAAEALKIISGAGTPLVGQLQMLDARTMEWNTLRYGRRMGCLVCG